MDLLSLFASLTRPSVAGSIAVAPSDTNWRIGRTYENHPAFLVHLRTRDGVGAPRRLANLVYRPPTPVDIVSLAGSESSELAIVECITLDRELIAYFLRVVERLLAPEAARGEEQRFEGALDAIITLFQSLQRPGTKTAQGLWAELATIAFASKPDIALACWHTSPTALHDFVNAPARLEVKSSTKQMHEHQFLYDQLQFGGVIVASMLLTRSESGCSISDLLAIIRARIQSPQAHLRLETIVADSLGASVASADEERFLIDDARLATLYYRAEEIPTVGPPPEYVKDVRFTADLSSTKPLPNKEVGSLYPQLRDLLPV